MNLNKLNVTEEEMIQLYDIHQAYNRPHPPAMSWRECKAMGLERKDFAGCGMIEIIESLDEIDTLSSFHLNDDGEVVPGEGERASWLDRRINQWSRR